MFLPPDRFWYECRFCGYAIDRHDLALNGKKENKQNFANFCKECAKKQVALKRKGDLLHVEVVKKLKSHPT